MSQAPVRLLPPAEAAELPAADADGQRVLDRVAEGSNVVVLGAPGTGKTSLALRLLAERRRSNGPYPGAVRLAARPGRPPAA